MLTLSAFYTVVKNEGLKMSAAVQNATAAALAAQGGVGSEVKPDWTCFLGMIMYFGFTLTVIPELLESEELREALRCREFEYRAVPAYQAAGVLVGFVSYGIAFRSPESLAYQPGHYGHTFFTAAVFFLMAKHLAKLAELAPRRASMAVSLGMLPLLCKAVLEAESVNVKSCSSFYALLVLLVLLPVFMVLRDFRSAPTNKYRKRLACLFFALICYFGTLSPKTLCSAGRSDFAKSAAFAFDVVVLLVPNLDL